MYSTTPSLPRALSRLFKSRHPVLARGGTTGLLQSVTVITVWPNLCKNELQLKERPIAAHDNVDFLPWFLAKMKAAEQTVGKRLLDFLGTHTFSPRIFRERI